jgi:chitin biosynthesis protein CHS5
MTDTSGISVCFGTVEEEELLESAKQALEEMRARWSDKVQIDTTHFVCTSPASKPSAGGLAGAPGVEYKRALQHSIPIVHPNWILACHQEKKSRLVFPFSPLIHI